MKNKLSIKVIGIAAGAVIVTGIFLAKGLPVAFVMFSAAAAIIATLIIDSKGKSEKGNPPS